MAFYHSRFQRSRVDLKKLEITSQVLEILKFDDAMPTLDQIARYGRLHHFAQAVVFNCARLKMITL